MLSDDKRKSQAHETNVGIYKTNKMGPTTTHTLSSSAPSNWTLAAVNKSSPRVTAEKEARFLNFRRRRRKRSLDVSYLRSQAFSRRDLARPGLKLYKVQ